MNTRSIKDNFWRIGARVMVEPRRGPVAFDPLPHISVAEDELGEHFRLRVHPLRVRGIEVRDIRPAQRRLLLVVRQRPRKSGDYESARDVSFLCACEPNGLLAHRLPECSQAHRIELAQELLASHSAAVRAQFERHRRQFVVTAN